MKRYGACSLREDGPCFGRPTPLQFGSTRAGGRVADQTQVVDFHDFSRFFMHVLMSGERDRPGRRGVRPARRSGRKQTNRDVVGETPTTAVETTALPRNGFQGMRVDWRSFAVALQFLKFQKQLMQLVDFHDSFSYFWHVFNRKPGESSASRLKRELCRKVQARGNQSWIFSAHRGRFLNVRQV